MNCVDSVTLPFSITINVPEGFYYNDESQLSVAVSTDDLNIYVVEESFSTDSIKNSCTGEFITGVKVYIQEIRMSGILAFRMGLNALVSSYNFMLGSQSTVNGDGWSSSDGFVNIKVEDEGVLKDYVVLGYVNKQDISSIPTREDITVMLNNYNVVEHTIGNEGVLEVTGTFSFLIP